MKYFSSTAPTSLDVDDNSRADNSELSDSHNEDSIVPALVSSESFPVEADAFLEEPEFEIIQEVDVEGQCSKQDTLSPEDVVCVSIEKDSREVIEKEIVDDKSDGKYETKIDIGDD